MELEAEGETPGEASEPKVTGPGFRSYHLHNLDQIRVLVSGGLANMHHVRN